MVIEVGKTYLTRDNRKAIVTADVGKNPFGTDHQFPLYGYIEAFGLSNWKRDGRFGSFIDGRDLVSEYREPRSAGLHIRAVDYGNYLLVTHPGNVVPSDKILAACTLTYTEGQGFKVEEVK